MAVFSKAVSILPPKRLCIGNHLMHYYVTCGLQLFISWIPQVVGEDNQKFTMKTQVKSLCVFISVLNLLNQLLRDND